MKLKRPRRRRLASEECPTKLQFVASPNSAIEQRQTEVCRTSRGRWVFGVVWETLL